MRLIMMRMTPIARGSYLYDKGDDDGYCDDYYDPYRDWHDVSMAMMVRIGYESNDPQVMQ